MQWMLTTLKIRSTQAKCVQLTEWNENKLMDSIEQELPVYREESLLMANTISVCTIVLKMKEL